MGENLRVILCAFAGIADVIWYGFLKDSPEFYCTRLRCISSWLAIYFGLALYPIANPSLWGVFYAICTSLTAVSTLAAAVELNRPRWTDLTVATALGLWAYALADYSEGSRIDHHHALLTAIHAAAVALTRRLRVLPLMMAMLAVLEVAYYGWAWRWVSPTIFPSLQLAAKSLGYVLEHRWPSSQS